MELTEQTVDGQDIAVLAPGELERVRRDLNASLPLPVTGSAANCIIRGCRNAVAAELDRRAGTDGPESPMIVAARNVDGLATWQLRDYRQELEQAIAALPEAAPLRQVYAGRLREVVTEQEGRSKTTGLPVIQPGLMNQGTGEQVMLPLPGDRRAADFRSGTAKTFRVCSCGAAFAEVTALDAHLDESGDDSSHEEMALDLDTLVRFGIRRIRTERGLSMQAMADLLGVHASAICRIEGGKRHAVGWGRTPRTIATLLGIDVPELLRVCAYCAYRPPAGCQCLRCGMLSAADPEGNEVDIATWQGRDLFVSCPCVAAEIRLAYFNGGRTLRSPAGR
jgi:DNA-binding XRE family transcriptional regulator